MFPVSRLVCLSAAVTLSAGALCAQNVLSAKSGLVQYLEGDVKVAAKPVVDRPGVFVNVNKDEQLETAQGRAEVLLTPGVFLRVGEQSSIRMLNTSLADTRLEIVGGRSMVEVDTPMKGNQVTVLYQGYATIFVKHGLYEFQTSPAQVKVYSGELQVSAGDQTVTVHEGRSLVFTAALAQERFDSKDGDSLYRWSKSRSEYLSIANISAARYVQGGSGFQNGLLSGGSAFGGLFGGSNGYLSGNMLGGGYGNSGGAWAFNNAYGMYTYLPYSGIGYSPFGLPYYSPNTVYQAYSPNYYAPGNYGTVTNNHLNHAPIVSARSPGAGSERVASATALATSNNNNPVSAGGLSGAVGHSAARGK